MNRMCFASFPNSPCGFTRDAAPNHRAAYHAGYSDAATVARIARHTADLIGLKWTKVLMLVSITGAILVLVAFPPGTSDADAFAAVVRTAPRTHLLLLGAAAWSYLRSASRQRVGMVLALLILAVFALPVLAFLFFQKRLIEGITLSGLK